jgi:hypothetical protein
MDIYRKIAIVIIFILFSIILFRLLQKRTDIQKQFIETFVEGLTDCSKGVKNANKIAHNIGNAPTKYLENPLNSFYIKSAYGGGYNGMDICSDMILYTLSLGYRHMVINVFYDVVNEVDSKKPSTNKTAVVGFSSTYPMMTNGANHTMALSDFLPIIQQNAFTAMSPNPADPFFLHIIPGYLTSSPGSTNTQEMTGNNTQLNSQIEQALTLLQGSNRTPGKMKPDTTLDEIQGKLVVIMDTESTQGYMSNALKNMVNLSVPESDFIMAKGLSNSKKPFITVLPFDEKGSLTTSIINYIDLYSKYMMNVSPVCVWQSRYIGSSLIAYSNLGDYELLFSKEGGSAFVNLVNKKPE